MYDLVPARWVIFIITSVEKMKSRHGVGMHSTRVTSCIPTPYLNFSSENDPQKYFWIDNVFLKKEKISVKMFCIESGVALVLSASISLGLLTHYLICCEELGDWGSKAVCSPSVWVQLTGSDFSILNFIQEPLPHAAEAARISCRAFELLLVLHLIGGNI